MATIQKLYAFGAHTPAKVSGSFGLTRERSGQLTYDVDCGLARRVQPLVAEVCRIVDAGRAAAAGSRARRAAGARRFGATRQGDGDGAHDQRTPGAAPGGRHAEAGSSRHDLRKAVRRRNGTGQPVRLRPARTRGRRERGGARQLRSSLSKRVRVDRRANAASQARASASMPTA